VCFKEDVKRSQFIKKRVSQARGGPIRDMKLKAKEEEEHLYYGLGGNVIHLRLNKATENHLYNWNAITAFQHSSPLVIDFSFFANMTNKKHLKSLIWNEISNSYTWNRVARTPYALHFTNVTPEIEEMLVQVFQTDIMAPDFPALVSRHVSCRETTLCRRSPGRTTSICSTRTGSSTSPPTPGTI
jgi:hypothetical protein